MIFCTAVWHTCTSYHDNIYIWYMCKTIIFYSGHQSSESTTLCPFFFVFATGDGRQFVCCLVCTCSMTYICYDTYMHVIYTAPTTAAAIIAAASKSKCPDASGIQQSVVLHYPLQQCYYSCSLYYSIYGTAAPPPIFTRYLYLCGMNNFVVDNHTYIE